MRKFKLGQGDLYIPNEVVRDLGDPQEFDPQEFFDERLDLLFGSQPKYREFIDLYGKLNQLAGYAILAAHGDSNGKWTYSDGERESDVQNWINRRDGKYSGLLLCVCNPGHYTPRIRKSALLIADREISENPHVRDPIYGLLVPGKDEINSYTIDFEIEQLKRKLE